MTSPSSGVKPIVVSTLRPPDGGQRRARAQVAGHHPEPLRRRGPQLRGAPRGIRVGQAVESVAAQAEPLPPGRGQRVRRRGGRHPGVERGVEAGHLGHAGQQRGSASIPPRARGWCSGASSVTASISRRTAASSSAAAVSFGPPCTMRWPTASTPGEGVEESARAGRWASVSQCSTSVAARISSAGSSRLSLRLLDPALTTRTFMSGRILRGRLAPRRAARARPAGASGPGAPGAPGRGQGGGQTQSRTSGMSSPCSRT